MTVQCLKCVFYQLTRKGKANQPLPKSMLDGVPAWANDSCSLQKFYFRHSFDFVLGLGAIFFQITSFKTTAGSFPYWSCQIFLGPFTLKEICFSFLLLIGWFRWMRMTDNKWSQHEHWASQCPVTRVFQETSQKSPLCIQYSCSF